MRIIITGGSGFPGANMVNKWVSKGFNTLNIDTAFPDISTHNNFGGTLI